jgi:hypothetical protein
MLDPEVDLPYGDQVSLEILKCSAFRAFEHIIGIFAFYRASVVAYSGGQRGGRVLGGVGA